MDPSACNYDAAATVSDIRLCTFPVIGCTDSRAQNYQSTAAQDDGTCAIKGCADSLAVNYDSAANAESGGQFAGFASKCVGDDEVTTAARQPTPV